LFITLATIELQRNRDFTAGCLLGCCLFKFHLILALVVFLAALGRKKLLPGFALVFVALLLISVGISGWGFVTEYPRFLIKLSSLPIAGIHPAGMANIRGLISVSGIAKNAAARLALIWLVSIFLFWYAWRSFKGVTSNLDQARDLAFGNFLLVAILVSYHLSPSDLCIALLPIGLFSQYLDERPGIRVGRELRC